METAYAHLFMGAFVAKFEGGGGVGLAIMIGRVDVNTFERNCSWKRKHSVRGTRMVVVEA